MTALPNRRGGTYRCCNIATMMMIVTALSTICYVDSADVGSIHNNIFGTKQAQSKTNNNGNNGKGNGNNGNSNSNNGNGNNNGKSKGGRGIPDHVLDKIPDHVFDKFKNKSGIKSDYVLDLVQIDANSKTVKFPKDDTNEEDDDEDLIVDLNLDDFEPYSVFSTSGAKCRVDNMDIDCGEPTVYMKDDTVNDAKIQLNFNGHGQIDSMIVRKKGSGNGPKKQKVLQRVVDDDGSDAAGRDSGGPVYAYISDDALDEEWYSQFSTKAVDAPTTTRPEQRRSLRTRSNTLIENIKRQIIDDHPTTTTTADNSSSSRQLQTGACNNSYKEVELHVVADTSFCEYAGAGIYNNLLAYVNNLVIGISQEYEVDGLCFKVTMKSFEAVSTQNKAKYLKSLQLPTKIKSTHSSVSVFAFHIHIVL